MSDATSAVPDDYMCNAAGHLVPRELESEIEFALWSDGRLDIVDGDELIQIPPGAVKRLALLLGVPGTSSVSTLGA